MPFPYVRTPYRQGTRGWKQEQVTTIENFAGGLNNVDFDNVIADNESPNCRNMRFVGNTLMEKRPGVKKVELESGYKSSDAITWLDTYYPSLGDDRLVVASDKNIHFKKSNGIISKTSVMGAVHGVTYNGKYYYVDGKYLYVFDGNVVRRIITPPIVHVVEKIDSSHIKVDRIPVQTKVGDPVYITASIIGQQESIKTIIKSIEGDVIEIQKDFIQSFKVKDAPILLYDPGDEDALAGVEEKATIDNVNYCWYNPCLNELGDEFAGEPYMPDSPSVIAVHKNRLFIAGDSKQPHAIYCSAFSGDAPLPLYFPSGVFLQVKPNGKPIVDLVVFDDSLIIGRNEDLYVLYGSSEYTTISDDPFYIKQMDVTTGFMNTDCGALLNNYYIYLGYDGRFYKLNTPTTYVEYLMTRPLPFKCDIYSAPFNIPVNTVVRTSTTSYRNEVYFGINEDLVIVYNYDNQAYTYFTGWKSNTLCSDGLSLLVGRTDGVVAKYTDDDPVYTDMGNPIDACYETKRFDFGSSANYKYFKSFMTTSQAYDDLSSNILVNVEINNFKYGEDVLISSNHARFGEAMWGVHSFGNTLNLYKSPYHQLDVRGRTIKYIFKNNAISDDGKGETFRLYDINTLWSIRDVR